MTPAIEALPRAIKLQQLKRQLELARELVENHILATSEPVVSVVSDVRRMVVATPEGSAIHDAFTVLDAPPARDLSRRSPRSARRGRRRRREGREDAPLKARRNREAPPASISRTGAYAPRPL